VTPALVYELLAQAAVPHGPLDLEALAAALEQRGAVRQAQGWTVRLGGDEVALAPVREGGALVAVALQVPLDRPAALVEDAARFGLEVARELGLRLVDPQTASAVGTELGPVVDAFQRRARYAFEYQGLPGTGVDRAAVASEPRLAPATRYLVAAAVFLLALYGTFQVLTRLPRLPAAPPVGAPVPRAPRP
jgi:hypothetical protein